jgi:hypothetical protein
MFGQAGDLQVPLTGGSSSYQTDWLGKLVAHVAIFL